MHQKHDHYCVTCYLTEVRYQPRRTPKGQLIYRMGSDTYHGILDDTRILYVQGDHYQQEKTRLGYEGPEMCPVDYTEYWLEEAERGSFVCWIATWHVYEYYQQWGTSHSLADEHPNWGEWTTNKEIENEEEGANAIL